MPEPEKTPEENPQETPEPETPEPETPGNKSLLADNPVEKPKWIPPEIWDTETNSLKEDAESVAALFEVAQKAKASEKFYRQKISGGEQNIPENASDYTLNNIEEGEEIPDAIKAIMEGAHKAGMSNGQFNDFVEAVANNKAFAQTPQSSEEPQEGVEEPQKGVSADEIDKLGVDKNRIVENVGAFLKEIVKDAGWDEDWVETKFTTADDIRHLYRLARYLNKTDASPLSDISPEGRKNVADLNVKIRELEAKPEYLDNQSPEGKQIREQVDRLRKQKIEIEQKSSVPKI